jgi:uncharacterized protein (TIGR02147 family)
MKSVFEFAEYKAYLKEKIRGLPKGGRGFRSELAHALRCQTAYISQVLNAGAHFSLEQALTVNQFLAHSEEEARYFLLLIQYARAGTRELQNFFFKQMEEARARRSLIRERFKTAKELSTEDKLLYYSEWFYVGIHVLSSIPAYQSPQAIALYLKLPLAKVMQALEMLTHSGLVIQENGRYQVGETRIHLGSDSALISKHHINWRLEAIRALERGDAKDIHYSSIVSVSHDDFQKIKQLFIDVLEKYNKTIAASPEEDAACLTLDWFSLAR